MPYGFNDDYTKADMKNIISGTHSFTVTAGQSQDFEIDLMPYMSAIGNVPVIVATPCYDSTVQDYVSGVTVETYVTSQLGGLAELKGHITVHNNSSTNITSLTVSYRVIGS